MYMKRKLNIIDEYYDGGCKHVIYFDETYRVHEYVHLMDYSFVWEFDEFDKPELKNYRIVMELSSNKGSN